MHQALAALGRLNATLARISLWVAGFGLAAMTAIVFAEVIKRQLLSSSFIWVEPIAILLMAWFIFLGAAVGVYENFHMGFDVLAHFLPAGAGRAMRLVSDLAILAFSVAMIVYGWQLMARTWGSRMPIVGIPAGSSYMPLFAGGVLMSLFALEHILKNLTGTVDAVPTEADVESVLMTEA